MDRKMERETKKFFLQQNAREKDPIQQQSRSILLQQVRMRLKMKTLRQSKRRSEEGTGTNPTILTPTGSAWNDNFKLPMNQQGSITLREQDSDQA